MSELAWDGRLPSPPAGHLELPATPENLAVYPAHMRALHTTIRRVAARTRAPGAVKVAKEASALTGIPLSPAQVVAVLNLYSEHKWTETLPRKPMDLGHRSAPVAVRVEELG